VSALRSLLGYLHVAGDIPGPLAWAVPAVATWRLASLPAPLEPGQVTAMLAACDAATAGGRRDLAMLTLPARLGLRAGEVAALSLDDIDWRAGEITVTGVGEAVAAYLRDGRSPWQIRRGSVTSPVLLFAPADPAPEAGPCRPESAARAALGAALNLYRKFSQSRR